MCLVASRKHLDYSLPDSFPVTELVVSIQSDKPSKYHNQLTKKLNTAHSTLHTTLCFRSIVALHSFRLKLYSVKYIVHCTVSPDEDV